jgi:hypothetical protein
LRHRRRIAVRPVGPLVTSLTGTRILPFAPRGTYFVRLWPRNECGLGRASNEIVVPVQ